MAAKYTVERIRQKKRCGTGKRYKPPVMTESRAATRAGRRSKTPRGNKATASRDHIRPHQVVGARINNGVAVGTQRGVGALRQLRKESLAKVRINDLSGPACHGFPKQIDAFHPRVIALFAKVEHSLAVGAQNGIESRFVCVHRAQRRIADAEQG